MARIYLPEPTFANPEPTPGCDVCAALVRQWQAAKDPRSPAYDESKASDLIVELNRHQSGAGEGEM